MLYFTSVTACAAATVFCACSFSCNISPLASCLHRMSQQLIVLKQVLPGVDLAEILAKQPRLLYMEGAQEKV